MPHTNKELLDEASEDEPETPDVKREEQDFKEIDCTGNQTEISNGHAEDCRRELSEDMKDSVHASKMDSRKLAGEEHMKKNVGTEIIKKPSMDRMDEGVKCSQAIREPTNPELQTKSEEFEQSSKDISDDIDTGLDKCLSTIEKEIPEDGCNNVPDPDTYTSKGIFPHRENSINVKTVEIDGNPKDINDIPS